MEKYGEYGIDFISSLVFKDGADKNKWKRLHTPDDFEEFINDIDFDAENFKWGKLFYSYSDVWLFYVKDEEDNIVHLEAYSGRKMDSANLLACLKSNCKFAVNIKPESQMSANDRHDSATFYIKPELLEILKATREDVIHNLSAIGEVLKSRDNFENKQGIRPVVTTAVQPAFIGNKANKTYHLPTCKYVPKKQDKVVEFTDIKQAADAGYNLCPTCKP